MDNNMREKLETLPLTVLKEFAKDKKLKNVSTLRKKELIEALIEADKAERESEVQADKKIVSSSVETERGTRRQHTEKRNVHSRQDNRTLHNDNYNEENNTGEENELKNKPERTSSDRNNIEKNNYQEQENVRGIIRWLRIYQM